MEYKCCYKLKLEELLKSSKNDEKLRNCRKCNGYDRECTDYIDLPHILNLYKIFNKEYKR